MIWRYGGRLEKSITTKHRERIAMDLQQFRYVIAVAEEGNFTRAAERLYLSQPALSVQVRKLEQELGTPLFVRLAREVALTPAGEVFLDHARRALFEVELTRRKVEEVCGLRAGRVEVGVLPSVAASVLPAVLTRFHRQYPGVEVRLVEENISTHFEHLVHLAQLDLAVIRLPCGRRDLRCRRIVREPLLAMLPPDHPLYDRAEVSLAELADEDFVTMQPRYGLHELLLTVCAQAGYTPRISLATGQLSTVWGMVRAGVGVAVLPRMATGPDTSCTTRISDGFAVRELGVIWRADQPLSPGAAAFLRILTDDTASFDDLGAAPDELDLAEAG